jgi:hypothetical protein
MDTVGQLLDGSCEVVYNSPLTWVRAFSCDVIRWKLMVSAAALH